jgi:transglutaminase-like putative cysteine protease
MLIPYSLYQTYKSRRRILYGDAYDYGAYVSDPLDDPTLQDYAAVLWERGGKTKEGFIFEALAFVQGAIAYQADPPGVEYPLYPIETLTDGHGDCEDTAILYVSLLDVMNVTCKLAFVDTGVDGIPDHVLAFVALPNRLVPTLDCGEAATVFEWDGLQYALAETAVDGGAYPLGCDPWGIDESDIAQVWSFPHP